MAKKTKKAKKTSTLSKGRSGKSKKTSHRSTPTKKTAKTAKTAKTTKKTTKKTKTPPKGYVRLGLSEAHDRIRERLDDTRVRLPIGSRVYIHEYKNGTVDGEITVPVPRGKSADDISGDLEEAFQTVPHGLGRGFWYALGIRLSIHKDEAEDRSGSSRIRGMDDLMMYYRRVTTAKLIDSFLRQQRVMIPGAQKKYKRKVEIVYLRLHWNQSDNKPER